MKKFLKFLSIKVFQIVAGIALIASLVLFICFGSKDKYMKIISKFLSIKVFQILTGTALIASLGLFIYFGVYNPRWLRCFLGIDEKKEVIEFIGIGIAGLIGLFNVLAVLKRVVAQEKIAEAQLKNASAQLENNKSQEKIAEAHLKNASAQLKNNENQQQIIKAQHDSNEQKAFNDAIINLGSDKESVRLGGIYNLYKMAINKPAETENISEILCAHVRNTTQEEDYRKKYSKKPLNEIQSLLNILSRKKENPFKEIRLDLSSAYLRGANLIEAQLQGADLRSAQLEGADLRGAQLQGAYLWLTRLQEAILSKAQLEGAYLREAQLQRVNLWSAKLQGAYLWLAQLQEAHLYNVQLQGAHLDRAQLQGADLIRAQLQGANLDRAQLQGVDLKLAQLQRANLSKAQLQGADLSGAQLEGANLSKAQLQGAYLFGAQFQGADLYKAQLQGTFTEDIPIHSSGGFKKRIESRIEKNTELKTAIFAGGITKEYIERLKKDLSPMVEKKFLTQKWLDFLLKRLEPHVGKEPDYTLPENSGAITGILTKEMTEEIIKKYDEAMKL